MKHSCLGGALLLACGLAAAQAIDREAMLAAHNQWRAEVGVPALRYSAVLEASAQAWADQLKQTNQCRMRHSQTEGRYGENLYWSSALRWSDGRRETAQVSPAQVVGGWGSEKRDYSYDSNSCRPGKVCGHYTQLVWRSSTEVGCARAVCADSQDQVWVCQYQPAGNWVGRKPY